MNEQIRKLIEKSYYECPQVTSYMWENHIVPPEQWTKFAELIVKECAGLVQGVPIDTMGYLSADQKIKQHFGVE